MRILSRIKYLKSSADWIEFNSLPIWEISMIVRMKKNMMPVITTKIVQKSSINGKPILKPRKMSKSYFWLKYILSTIILSHSHHWINFIILFYHSFSHHYPVISLKIRGGIFGKNYSTLKQFSRKPFIKILNRAEMVSF